MQSAINAAFDMALVAANHLQIVAPGQQAQTPATIELREDQFPLCLLWSEANPGIGFA